MHTLNFLTTCSEFRHSLDDIKTLRLAHQSARLTVTKKSATPIVVKSITLKLHSHQSCQRRANQRLHLGRDEVSDWLDAQSSTRTAMV
ncbi:hypothetical protein TNCV_3568381 [Trichonephila clavipes]|nr:hypothetical protein TNCV_3568381 [Trichonephila clavipes]